MITINRATQDKCSKITVFLYQPCQLWLNTQQLITFTNLFFLNEKTSEIDDMHWGMENTEVSKNKGRGVLRVPAH